MEVFTNFPAHTKRKRQHTNQKQIVLLIKRIDNLLFMHYYLVLLVM